MLFPTNVLLSCRLWKFVRDRIVILIASVFRLSSSSISDAKYTSHDRLVAINWILIRFLQGYRKLPPCGEFQSRMDLVINARMFHLSIQWRICQSPRWSHWDYACLLDFNQSRCRFSQLVGLSNKEIVWLYIPLFVCLTAPRFHTSSVVAYNFQISHLFLEDRFNPLGRCIPCNGTAGCCPALGAGCSAISWASAAGSATSASLILFDLPPRPC